MIIYVSPGGALSTHSPQGILTNYNLTDVSINVKDTDHQILWKKPQGCKNVKSENESFSNLTFLHP